MLNRWVKAMNKDQFKFNLPPEWEDQTAYFFKGPDIDGQEHLLMLHLDRHLQQDDINDFARQRIAPITENLQGLEVLKDEEVTIEEGNPVYEFTCRWMPAEGISVLKKYIFVFYDNMGFTFNCDFSKKSYKMLSKQISSIIDSLLPGTYEPLED